MTSSLPERGSPDADARPLGDGTRIFALIALTAVAAGLWIARATQTGGPRFTFLWWNLFLAWVPWLISLTMLHARRLFWPLSVAWLAFFPNAPYLLTDLIHLKPRAGVPLWFDALLLACFAFVGCAVGWDSLAQVHGELQKRIGEKWAALGIATVVLLTGVGVFLGRFERLNSWEIVTDPRQVVLTASEALLEPKALIFSLAFAGFVGAGYLFSSGAARPRCSATSPASSSRAST
ncbi:MAG: DUF1361 domain-containing protein [Archangium sp.]